MSAGREPGWDAKTVSAVVAQHYGGRLAELFEAHGWPERGAAMMPAQGRRIVECYGSIAAFATAYENGRAGNFVLNPLNAVDGDAPQVLLKAYWGFDPENWPCLTLTDKGRLRTILTETQPGFLAVIYGNYTDEVPEEMRGRVVGIYQLSHQIGEISSRPSGLSANATFNSTKTRGNMRSGRSAPGRSRRMPPRSSAISQIKPMRQNVGWRSADTARCYRCGKPGRSSTLTLSQCQFSVQSSGRRAYSKMEGRV
jgi:hypothetical protein